MLHSFVARPKRPSSRLAVDEPEIKKRVLQQAAQINDDIIYLHQHAQNTLKELKEEREALEQLVAESQAILAARASMAPLNQPTTMTQDDRRTTSAIGARHRSNEGEVVRLNVGGTIFTTTRSTLCSVPGSMIEAMFGGRFTSPAIMDDTGAYFLDRDPEYFSIVLSYLRDPRTRPNPPSHLSRMAVLREFEYFGLLSDAGAYIAEPECEIICKRHLELSTRFSSFSVHGSRVYISTDTHIELWCLDTQECLAKMEISVGSLVRAIEATATRVFILCNDSEIQVWDSNLRKRISTINPETGFVGHFQIVHNADYTSPNPMLWSLDQGSSGQYVREVSMESKAEEEMEASEKRSRAGTAKVRSPSRECRFPDWRRQGSSAQMRSAMFFDGDVGIFALDLATLTISKVVEVPASGALSAFHVSGEELYYATNECLMAFNLRTRRSVRLTTNLRMDYHDDEEDNPRGDEENFNGISKLRVSQDGLLYVWSVLGRTASRPMCYDLKQRQWKDAGAAAWEDYPDLAECEVAGSLVVGREFGFPPLNDSQVVLWCSCPLLSPINSGSGFNTTDTTLAAQHAHQHQQNQRLQRQKKYTDARTVPKPRIIRLMSSVRGGTSFFFSFQASSVIVAQTSPLNTDNGGEEGTSSSIRVFQIQN